MQHLSCYQMLIQLNTQFRLHLPNTYSSRYSIKFYSSDVYSFGLITYVNFLFHGALCCDSANAWHAQKILTRKTPLDEVKHDFILVMKLRDGAAKLSLPTSSEIWPEYLKDLWELCTNCWKWDPKERYMNEVVTEVKQIFIRAKENRAIGQGSEHPAY